MFASSLNLSNPKLPLMKARAKNTIDLAFIKVVAHRQNPSQNPLPANPKSLERAFNDVLNAIPKHKQDDAMENFQGLLSPAARTQAYGDLGQVNFASATSVVDQVTALPLPAELHFTESDVADLKKQMLAKKLVGKALKNIGQRAGSAVATAAAPQQAVASSIDFEVVSATCVKPNDLIKDEIDMVIGTVDALGVAVEAGPLFVGKFKKGDTIPLGAAGKLVSFKVAEIPAFPASFPAFAFMIERDLISNDELVRKLMIALIATASALQAVAIAILALGLAGVVTAPGALVALIVLEIGAIAALVGFRIVSIMADDISFASGDTLVLDAPPAPGSVFERTLTIDGFGDYDRGTYNVLLRWSAVL